MSGKTTITRALRFVALAGVLAAGVGELAKLQGWRLRALLVRRAR